MATDLDHLNTVHRSVKISMGKTYLKHFAKLRKVSFDICSEFFAFLTSQATSESRREKKQYSQIKHITIDIISNF